MSKHYTVNIRVTETESVPPAPRTHGDQTRKVEEIANVTVRADSAEEALRKATAIIPSL